jgi:hypothetical protein
VNQGNGGPRRLHVVGTLKNLKEDVGLFVRIGIRAPDEYSLIPSVQVLYHCSEALHIAYREGEPIGIDQDADRWAYDFTERYNGIVKGVKVRTQKGIQSLCAIPAINEVLLGTNGFSITALSQQLK